MQRNAGTSREQKPTKVNVASPCYTNRRTPATGHAWLTFRYFLGLRPLAGYASLQLDHVMSWFLYVKRILRSVSRAPTQKADMGSRARARQRPQKEQPKKNRPQTSPETQTQQNTANSSVLWLGSGARASQEAENQREKCKDRAAREPATARAKRTEQQPNAQRRVFGEQVEKTTCF